MARVSTSTDRRLALVVLIVLAVPGLLAVRPAAAGETPPRAAEVALAQLELDYAKSGGVYLLIDPKARSLEIRIRGMVIESLPLTGMGFYAYRRARSAQATPPIELPGVWTVDEDATAPYRKVIAPTELVPYSEEEVEPPPPPPPPPGAPAQPPADHEATLPDVYRVHLDRGFELSVGRSLPPTDLWSRLRQAFADGWARLRRRPIERPDLLALALEAEAANKLHFRLRSGTPLLVAAP